MHEPSTEENNWRKILAKNVVDMRKSERKGYVINHRGAAEYIDILLGLQHFFEYVKGNALLGRPNLVVDLGAGNTNAVSQLAKMSYCQGLDFEATGLTPPKNINQYLGASKLHLTTFEALSGFKPESLGGAISVYGEGYATNPERAMEKLNEKLAPGGVFKANFQHPKKVNPYLTFFTHDRFSKRLELLGYDISVVDSAPQHESQILLAIKKPSTTSASFLIEQDRTDFMKRINELLKTQPR